MITKLKIANLEKLILIIIMIFLIGMPVITVFNYTCYCLNFNNSFIINRAYLLWTVGFFLFFLYIFDLIFNKKKMTFVDILIYLLIILGALSTIFAVDTKVSIYGVDIRNEGLFSLLSYYFIFLNVKNMSNEKYKNIIINTIIILGVVQIVYGILQVYTNWWLIVKCAQPYMASGLSGNPNFFGSYMVILASIMFSMYMLEHKRKYLVLLIIFFIGLCLASSSGPFISFLLIVIFFVIYYRKKIKLKDLLKVLILLVSTYFIVDISVKLVQTNIFKQEIDPNYNIFLELKNLSLSNFGNGRIKLWKESLPLVKKYWAVGAGLDNFGKVYGVRNGIYYDKAHNVYLQIAITNGIPALIIYMVIMAFIFFKGLKIKNSLYISLLMAFTGYCIQSFANISVIEVAPTFFVICGLLLGKIQKTNSENNKI